MLPLCNMQWNCDSSDIFNMLAASSPAFKPGMKRDSNNDFLQIISNPRSKGAGKLNVLTAKYQGGHDDISHRNKSSEKRV